MKKLLLLSAVVVSMLFNTACSSDDDSSGSGGSIVGSWQLESFFINGEDDTLECETMDTRTFTSTEVTIISFESENGECVAGDPVTLPYVIDGNEITIDDDTSEFSVEGDILIFTFENTDVDEGEPNDIDIVTFRRI